MSMWEYLDVPTICYFSLFVPEVSMENSGWLQALVCFCNAVAEHVAQSGVLLYLGLLRVSCFPCALSRQEKVCQSMVV